MSSDPHLSIYPSIHLSIYLYIYIYVWNSILINGLQLIPSNFIGILPMDISTVWSMEYVEYVEYGMIMG